MNCRKKTTFLKKNEKDIVNFKYQNNLLLYLDGMWRK